MKLALKILTCCAFLLPLSAQSETIELNSGTQKTTLMELYTSEGCSSCPPADRWLSKFKQDERLWSEVIPIAYHVDYWDYIGWKDPFASENNSLRQYRYHREKGIKTVYTPGFIKNGKEWKSWFGLDRSFSQEQATPGNLKVIVENNVVKAEFDSELNNVKPLKLNVAILGFGLETEVRAGENHGKTLSHDFVMLGQSTQQSNTQSWSMPLPEYENHDMKRKGIAVWVSSDDQLKPIQTVGGWLN